MTTPGHAGQERGIGHNSQNRQTVYRRHGNRAHTAILNSFLQDSRISHETKGLVAEMLSYPEDWDFTVQYLTKNGRSGRDKVYRMLKEAEQFGYIIPFQYRALDGKIQKQTYLVSDDPQALILAVAEELHALEKLGVNDPLPEKAEVAKPLVSNPLPKKPETGFQEVVDPLPEKPDTAQPDTGNPTQTNNIYNKKTQDKLSNDPLDEPAPEIERRKKKTVSDLYTDDFNHFWALYPKREGKGEAAKSWHKLSMDEKRRAYAGLKKQLPLLEKKMQTDGGKYCPFPATWINQGRFDDEPERRSTATTALDRDIPDFMPRPREDA